MKVWQPGSHLSEARGGEVRDWSWKRTRRRMGLLVRLALPYRGRTALSLGTLLAYTVVALAPPYLAKLAIDQGIKDAGPQPADAGSSRSSSAPRCWRSSCPPRTRT